MRIIEKTSLILAALFLLSGCSLKGKPFNPDAEIHIVSREDGSGTRGAFVELAGIAVKDEKGELYDHTTAEAIITNSTSVVMTAVAGDSQAIGYLSLGSLSGTVKPLMIDGASPNASEIKAGSYPLARPFLLATKGEQSPLVEDFINFIISTEGQKVVEDTGYVSVGDPKPYENRDLEGKIVIGGSSSVTPVMEKLREAYKQYHPNVTIEVQQSDSTTGISSVISGNYDIGMASRSLKESEVSGGLVDRAIAMDGIVVIVSHNNPIDNIAMTIVDEVFRGELGSWADVVASSAHQSPEEKEKVN